MALKKLIALKKINTRLTPRPVRAKNVRQTSTWQPCRVWKETPWHSRFNADHDCPPQIGLSVFTWHHPFQRTNAKLSAELQDLKDKMYKLQNERKVEVGALKYIWLPFLFNRFSTRLGPSRIRCARSPSRTTWWRTRWRRAGRRLVSLYSFLLSIVMFCQCRWQRWKQPIRRVWRETKS